MKIRLEDAAVGGTFAAGCGVTVVGVVGAGSAATGTISAVGAVVGGVAGGVVGSGVGIATGGAAVAATVPFAAAGAAIGGWAGPALALVGIGTAPAWALPAAVVGTVLVAGSGAVVLYRWVRSRRGAEGGSRGEPRSLHHS
jgi:hypothetical protein